jgi:hypothetical protein
MQKIDTQWSGREGLQRLVHAWPRARRMTGQQIGWSFARLVGDTEEIFGTIVERVDHARRPYDRGSVRC